MFYFEESQREEVSTHLVFLYDLSETYSMLRLAVKRRKYAYIYVYASIIH